LNLPSITAQRSSCPSKVSADKATVECSVGIVSTWILASLRNVQFLSLHELNEAIAEKLIEFNNKPFQKKEGSRAAAFSEEKIFLLPLPPRPYELATWKIATVQYITTISAQTTTTTPYRTSTSNAKWTCALRRIWSRYSSRETV
jgi:hypothetical protein